MLTYRHALHHMVVPRLESLERRELLSSVPFGATVDDTAEYMLGDVVVSLVLLESDGSIDADLEQWTPELIQEVKENVAEGLQWWTDTLEAYSDVHQLRFIIDETFADNPVATGYEPISRRSDDFILWLEDFFEEAGVDSTNSFSDKIRQFNHEQRIAHGANWAFTIFVVNADEDADSRFALDGSFSRAFAYPGGRFLVMPNTRPASTVAHETAHIFWAYDEYSDGEPYTATRGYYNTQNTNAANGHPDPSSREPSIMISTAQPYVNHQISQSAREMIGWRDSDGDGIFDVLDVDHSLEGTSRFDIETRTIHFNGSSHVNTLPNQNPFGQGNDITLNRITELQYRIDDGPWISLEFYDDYRIEFDVTTPPIPEGSSHVEFRTIDGRIGVASELVQVSMVEAAPPVQPRQNPINPFDVSGDGLVTAIDALRIIRAIHGGSELGDPNLYLDVTGDTRVTARDVLFVVMRLNGAETSELEALKNMPQHAELDEPVVAAADPIDIASSLLATDSLATDSLANSSLATEHESLTHNRAKS